MKTKVIFYKEPETGILAVFPDERFGIGSAFQNCYSHIGQHSGCHPSYVKELEEAEIRDYQDLLRELVSIGYDLIIMNSQLFTCHRPPTRGEIKFGEGATHYRDFPLSVIGLQKGKALQKKWFVSPDDKLRYYTY